MTWIRALVGSIRFRVPLAMILIVAGLFVAFLRVYEAQITDRVHAGEVEAARSLLLMTEAVREDVEARWASGLYSAEAMLLAHRDSSVAADDRFARVLGHVPIVNAWTIAERKATEGRYEFRPVREGARDPDNEPNAVEKQALDAFEADASLDEYWIHDETERAIRYFRPVRLTESCLVCHGDPKRSDALWERADGRDITGGVMEGKKVGDLHGAFEIVRSLDAAEAELRAEIGRAYRLGAVAVAAVALLLLGLIELLVGRPLARRIAGMRYAESSLDLSYRLPARGSSTEIRQMSQAFNGFLDPFHQGIADVARAVTGVMEDSTSVAKISAQTFESADRQTEKTQQLASAMEEFAITSSEMAETAARTKSFTEAAEEAAHDGRRVVSEVADAIVGLSDEVRASTEVVLRLNEQAAKIGSVVDVIRDIAGQTNLLSLNAAIEAARAGAAGRGFAVVADEVRALANRTSESTQEIQTIVDEVQRSTAAAAEAMQRSHGMASASVDTSRSATEALERITRSNREISDAAAHIASAAQEQRDVTRDMAENITSISEGARGMCDGATSTRESTVRIVRRLSELEEMVRTFHLGSDAAFDFDRARSAHRAWMTRLRPHLDGQDLLSETEFSSPQDCKLGRWIQAKDFRGTPTAEPMRRVAEAHERLHALAVTAREHKRERHRPEFEATLREIDVVSTSILNLIDEVEAVCCGGSKSVELF